MLECNLLGSGPRRKMFVDNSNLVNIGCNIPWTRFDYTFIDHRAPLLKLLSVPESIPEPTKLIISNNCLRFLKEENHFKTLKHRIHEVFMHHSHSRNVLRRNSLHYAAEWSISKGFKKLNIYGCDNWFGDRLCKDNWSHTPNTIHFIDPKETTFMSDEQLFLRGEKWIETWNYLINLHSDVEFNFI